MSFKRIFFFAFLFGAISSLGWAEDAASLMAQADAAYAKRADIPEDKIALITYQRAAEMDAHVAVEANWKSSRAAWWLGRHSESRADQLKYFQTGIDLAQKAIAINPDSIDAHFWLGVTMGSYGESKGVLKSLSMVKPIRREMAVVMKLDDHYMGGGAYRVLGVVDYKVPGLFGGNRSRAHEELTKALELGPNDPFTHYYLAEYYKLTGDAAKSQEQLTALRTLQVAPEFQPELTMLQKQADQNFK